MRRRLTQGFNLYAAGFGCGYAPWAPGTVGTFPGMLQAYGLLRFGMIEKHIAFLVLLYLAFHSANIRGKAVNDHDHSSIVCDEMIGVLLPLMYLPFGWKWVCAFVLFRIFDIWKPGPIGYLDQNVKGAWGCLADDLLAGVLTLLCLYWL